MSTALAYRGVIGTSFSAATGLKTILNAIAVAGHGQALTEAALSFDGVTTTAVPAVVEVVQSTQAGAGTPGTAPIVTQVRGRATGGTATTMAAAYSAEPTVLTQVSRWFIPQFMGSFTYQLPLGREIETDSSAGTVKGVAIRINTSATVNVTGHAEVENL